MCLEEIRHNPGFGMLPHVMQTRPATIEWATQANLPRQGVEHSVDLAAIQPITSIGDEDIRGNRSSGPPSIPSRKIVGQHATSRVMNGNQASVAERRMPNRQHDRLENDIRKNEV